RLRRSNVAQRLRHDRRNDEGVSVDHLSEGLEDILLLLSDGGEVASDMGSGEVVVEGGRGHRISHFQ
ncbi:MAG: hypothetical protein O3A46_11835, partial [Candidatus Poribacteria bacterium]|nr:hypothetical protein [Candidatus Poribacteria bacterium]